MGGAAGPRARFIAPVNAVMWPLVMRKKAQHDMNTNAANVKRMIEASH